MQALHRPIGLEHTDAIKHAVKYRYSNSFGFCLGFEIGDAFCYGVDDSQCFGVGERKPFKDYNYVCKHIRDDLSDKDNVGLSDSHQRYRFRHAVKAVEVLFADFRNVYIVL